MLNKSSLQALSCLSGVTDSMIISWPITGVKASNGTIAAFINLENIGVQEFPEFGVLKFKELVDLLNIAGADSEAIVGDDGIITISSSAVKCKYYTTSTSILEEHFRAKVSMLEKTSAAESALEFSLSNQQIDQLKKAGTLLKVEDIVVSGKDGTVTITAENLTQSSSNGFSLIPETASIFEDSEICISTTNFSKLPAGNYDVKIAKNGTSYVTRFDSKSVEGLTIVILAKAYQRN